MRHKVELRRPELALFDSFTRFVSDMRAHGQPLWDPYLPKESEPPSEFVARLVRRETAPERPFVPESIYWGVLDGEVAGRISLRHRLEGNLHRIGGHIGFEVSPRFRKRGVATGMLRELLQTPRAREIGKLLLTCSPENLASNRVIQACGGVLTQRIFVDLAQEDRNHYWITLS